MEVSVYRDNIKYYLKCEVVSKKLMICVRKQCNPHAEGKKRQAIKTALEVAPMFDSAGKDFRQLL